MIVINLHFVKDIGVERKIVRTVGGFKERVNVQNHRDPVRVVKADECVPVGDVCGTIQSGNWSFAVAGRKQVAWKQHDQRQQREHRTESVWLHGVPLEGDFREYRIVGSTRGMRDWI